MNKIKNKFKRVIDTDDFKIINTFNYTPEDNVHSNEFTINFENNTPEDNVHLNAFTINFEINTPEDNVHSNACTVNFENNISEDNVHLNACTVNFENNIQLLTQTMNNIDYYKIIYDFYKDNIIFDIENYISLELTTFPECFIITKNYGNYLSTIKNGVYYENTGLGNNLFQIASCYALSKKNNLKFTVPGLLIFKYLHNYDLENSIFRKISYKKLNRSQRIKLLDNEITNTLYNYAGKEINGYMECFLNFHNYYGEICDLFSLSVKDKDKINNLLSGINLNTACSIHIRRGADFEKIYEKTKKDIFKFLDHYYIKSICYVLDISKGNINTFIICSNDKEWTTNFFNNLKDNLIKNINILFINEADYIDMYAMSMCQYNIIGNSTLSWWSAYLNQNKNKLVICPKERDHDKYYLPEWIVL